MDILKKRYFNTKFLAARHFTSPTQAEGLRTGQNTIHQVLHCQRKQQRTIEGITGLGHALDRFDCEHVVDCRSIGQRLQAELLPATAKHSRIRVTT